MERVRELFVTYEEADVAVPVAPAVVVEEGFDLPRRRPVLRIAVAVLLCLSLLLGIGSAALQFGVPMVRYYSGVGKLDRGEFVEALRIFEQLGDYRDAREKLTEAERGIFYLEANLLLEQGDREGAIPLLEQAGDILDAGAILKQIQNELLYERAEQRMANGSYRSAWDDFAALGAFRDAQQKAEECRILTMYETGMRLYRKGEWLEAYRTLLTIRDANHRDTAEILDKILSRANTYAQTYAQLGERGKMLAFLGLVEEGDAAAGSALRAELMEEETFTADQSFYYFDTTHIERFTANTPTEEFASVVLYMLIYGKMEYSLMSNKAVEYDLLLDRAFQSCDLVGEIIPGYGSIYNPSVSVGDNYVVFYLDHEQTYSEHERTQHLKLFKSFCEDSVRLLTEAGLLSESMTVRQKTEVINNWVGFYLTYDHSLTTHDVGAAIEKRRGVCEAYAALYNRMCNLAGIPTYGQVGIAGSSEDARHIWSFHVDENGNIFFADATWADPWAIDFGAPGQEAPTVEQFVEEYLERCMKLALIEQNEVRDSGDIDTSRNIYLYSAKRWLSHQAERSEETIIAYHDKITGKAS